MKQVVVLDTMNQQAGSSHNASKLAYSTLSCWKEKTNALGASALE